MGYEIAEQLGWQVPDVILYPAGGGVGLIGIHKAMLEMQELGWIGDEAAAAGRRAVDRLPADRGRVRRGARREHARGGHAHARVRHQRAQGARRLPGAPRPCASPSGTAIAVSDEAILAELGNLAAAEGTWICPEGAACLAAARELRESGWIRRGRAGRRAQHRDRAEVPRDGAGRRTRASAGRSAPAGLTILRSEKRLDEGELPLQARGGTARRRGGGTCRRARPLPRPPGRAPTPRATGRCTPR